MDSELNMHSCIMDHTQSKHEKFLHPSKRSKVIVIEHEMFLFIAAHQRYSVVITTIEMGFTENL